LTYRKFDTATWRDKNFETLDPMERYLFIYFWTNDHCNQSGIYEITERRILFDTKVPPTTLEPTLKGISRMVHYDTENEVVFIKNFLKQQCQNKQFAESALKIVSESYPEYLNQFISLNKKLLKKYKIKTPEVGPTPLEPPTNPPTTPTVQNSTEQNRIEKKQDSSKDGPYSPPSKDSIENSSAKKLQSDIDAICKEIYDQKIFPDVYKWKNQMLKKNRNERAVLHTLMRCLVKRKFESGPWAYCTKIIQVENGNFNERDFQKIAS
jgi:hypothetical protein